MLRDGRTEGQTDMAKLIVVFSPLFERPARVVRPCPRRDSNSAIRSIEQLLTCALDSWPQGRSAEYTRTLHDNKHIKKNNIIKSI